MGSLCVADGCGDRLTGCCNPHCNNDGCNSHASRCAIAELIQESKTACYARDRRDAIHALGDHYDCCCHPEIMQAFVYALNDSDERVRAKAADEIGDQMRRRRCIVGAPVVGALKYSLADCDRGVRRQAEEALQLCGYDVVNGCCQGQYCASACDSYAPQTRLEPLSAPMNDQLLPPGRMQDPIPVPELPAPTPESELPASSDDGDATVEPTTARRESIFTSQMHEIRQVSADCGLATSVE